MLFIPGPLIAFLTFPGVIVHEAAHQLMCRLTKTPVLQVCYIRAGNPSGYVIHDAPASGWKHFLISVAPFLINSIVGALICLPVALGEAARSLPMGLMDIGLGWLGISVAMHAFPSTGDAASLWKAMKGDGASWLLRLVGWPVVAVIYLGALLSAFWFDVIYAWLICFRGPLSLLESLV
ncbi:metalloprotease family protein [Prosthecobacter sp.]|uniref:metalloprotease family protein n=1 Tax=Prosthecobacter sp. TaxID=1965333 RepID=UPI00378318AF